MQQLYNTNKRKDYEMASKDTVTAAWYAANLAGNAGESARSSTYWYRGKFLFHDDTPVARLEKSPVNQLWHLFNRREGQHYVSVTVGSEPFQQGSKTYKRAVYLNRFAIHDIGLRTPYATEPVEEGVNWQLLTLWQLEQEHLSWLTAVTKVAVGSYIDYPHQKENNVHQCRKAYEEYENFHRLFAPHRPTIEDRSPEVREIIDSRINKYMDPKRVEQRQRAKARKLLAEALEL